jgi:hypothetical protein
MSEGKTHTRKRTGRPSNEFSADILRLMEQYQGSSTVTHMCEYLGISSTVFYKWLANEPTFSEAVMEAKSRVDDLVEAAFLKRAKGYRYSEVSERTEEGIDKEGNAISKYVRVETPKHLPPDAGAALNWLKNRRPDQWRDKTVVELTGDHAAMVEQFIAQREAAKNET